MKALLSDVTNVASPSKRSCKNKAEDLIFLQTCCGAPRGNSLPSPPPVNTLLSEDNTVQKPSPPPVNTLLSEDNTVQKLTIHRKDVLEGGVECLNSYIERNCSFALLKACALRIFGGCILNGKRIMEAAEMASVCSGFSSTRIRKWAAAVFCDYFGNISNLDDITDDQLNRELESGKGRHPKWVSLMSDEGFQEDVKQYVLEHSYVKGKPNMTLQQLVLWLKETHQVEVCTSTVSNWLHDLGFTYKQFSKGVYFDGHERGDVMEDREAYLAKLQLYSPRLWVSHSPAPNPQCQPLIRVFHDESTFYANADQSFHWTDGTKQVLKQKSLGQSIMVSDFIDEVGGFLQHDGEKARLQLEHQSEGYFNNEMLLKQVDNAVTIFEARYPSAQAVFIFDHAPSHMKTPEDALNVDRMNVRDGGKQPFMRDTVWDGQVQRMVTDDGIQKGLRTVLEERGINTKGMNAEKLKEVLGEFEVKCSTIVTHTHTETMMLTHMQDFKDKTTLLQQLIEGRGHICLYLPKFHCELNPIEQCWCHAKKHTRANCNGSIVRLRKIIPESLDGIGNDVIARFFSRSSDYECAYREGHTCHTVDKAVKTYKSHRRISTAAEDPT
jgi:hypothetical protein